MVERAAGTHDSDFSASDSAALDEQEDEHLYERMISSFLKWISLCGDPDCRPKGPKRRELLSARIEYLEAKLVYLEYRQTCEVDNKEVPRETIPATVSISRELIQVSRTTLTQARGVVEASTVCISESREIIASER